MESPLFCQLPGPARDCVAFHLSIVDYECLRRTARRFRTTWERPTPTSIHAKLCFQLARILRLMDVGEEHITVDEWLYQQRRSSTLWVGGSLLSALMGLGPNGSALLFGDFDVMETEMDFTRYIDEEGMVSECTV